MGEYADDAFDMMEEEEFGLARLFGAGAPAKPMQRKRCKHCGLSGLKWTQTKDGWRLEDVLGRIHECLKVPRSTPESDFSEVPDDDEYTKAARG